MNKEVYFKLGVVAIIAYFIYFSVVLVNLYSSFHEFNDFTIAVYNLYYNSHNFFSLGLQAFAMDEHLSLDSILLTVLYSIVQSPLTILIVQLSLMCIAAFLILKLVSDLTGEGFLALALCMAFLTNAGTLGLVIYDSHIEFMIPLFYLMTFYFYMKSQFKSFILSVILLLGSADVTPILALFLGIGLVAYERIYNKQELTRTNERLAYYLIGMSIVAIIVYSFATSSLEASYTTGYQSLPYLLKIANGAQNGLIPSLSGLISNPIGKIASNIQSFALGLKAYLIYSVLLVAFGLGIGVFFDPIVALIVAMPWLAGILIVGDTDFVVPLSEFFGYIITPMVVASILGLIIYKERYQNLSRMVKASAIGLPIAFSIIAPLFYLFVFSWLSQYHSINTTSMSQIFLFNQNISSQQAYSQLDSMINKVPINASVSAQYYDSGHLAERQYLNPNFRPKYILLDYNKNISDGMCIFDNCTKLNDSITNYSIYARNGSAILYEMKQ